MSSWWAYRSSNKKITEGTASEVKRRYQLRSKTTICCNWSLWGKTIHSCWETKHQQTWANPDYWFREINSSQTFCYNEKFFRVTSGTSKILPEVLLTLKQENKSVISSNASLFGEFWWFCWNEQVHVELISQSCAKSPILQNSFCRKTFVAKLPLMLAKQ